MFFMWLGYTNLTRLGFGQEKVRFPRTPETRMNKGSRGKLLYLVRKVRFFLAPPEISGMAALWTGLVFAPLVLPGVSWQLLASVDMARLTRRPPVGHALARACTRWRRLCARTQRHNGDIAITRGGSARAYRPALVGALRGAAGDNYYKTTTAGRGNPVFMGFSRL